MSKNNVCPCCSRHCDMRELSCKRGKEYAKKGIASTQKHEREKSSVHNQRYDSLDNNNRLIWNLRDIGQYVRNLSEGKGSQKRILVILDEIETITQRELTERLGVKPGSASEVIGKLEKAGLIVRTQSEDDRRTTNIRLTDAGKSQAKKAARKRLERHQTMFSSLTEEEKEIMITLLEKVNTDWEQRYSEKLSKHKHSKHSKHHNW